VGNKPAGSDVAPHAGSDAVFLCGFAIWAKKSGKIEKTLRLLWIKRF